MFRVLCMCCTGAANCFGVLSVRLSFYCCVPRVKVSILLASASRTVSFSLRGFDSDAPFIGVFFRTDRNANPLSENPWSIESTINS